MTLIAQLIAQKSPVASQILNTSNSPTKPHSNTDGA